MIIKKDIQNIEDIRLLVDTFYGKVQKDDLIGPIFNGIIKDGWPEHLEKLYRFWQTILLDEHTYYGSPFAPHAQLPIGEKHFTQWVYLFHETLDTYFEGERADKARKQSEQMASIFQSKIYYIQGNREV